MFEITVDIQGLAHPSCMIAETDERIDRQAPARIRLDAGSYGIVRATGLPQAFRFQVSSSGLIDYEAVHDAFLEGRGTAALRVTGLPIVVDGTALSHDVLPLGFGSGILVRDQQHKINLLPGTGYGFQPASGIVSDLRFDVDLAGNVQVADQFAQSATADGSTLTLDGHQITIDGRRLSHDVLPLGMLGMSQILTRDRTHTVRFLPASGYGFQPASGIVSDLRFDVDLAGNVQVADQFAQSATADGSTLTLDGHQITIDGRRLSHDVLPLGMLGMSQILTRDRTHTVRFLPASGYGFQPASGIVSDLRFDLDLAGNVQVADQFAQSATADGSTLTLDGHQITIDGRRLSHDVLPLGMLGMSQILTRDRTHTVRFLPASGYGFQPASGIVSDLRFDLDLAGRVHVDFGFAGFASVAGSTLTLDGHQITIDGRRLSHDVLPLGMLGMSQILTRDRTHTVRFLPASGYGFQPASGIVSDLRYRVDLAGQIKLDSAFPGFVTAIGSTLTLRGYQISIDGRQLPHDLLVATLGMPGVLSRDRTHEFRLLPTDSYTLTEHPAVTGSQFTFRLDQAGRVTTLNFPPALTVTRPVDEHPGVTLKGLGFVNWMTADDSFALGQLHGQVVTLSGRLGGGAVVDNSFVLFASAAHAPALHQSDTAYIVAAPQQSADPHRFTIVFGAPIRDPVLHVYSLASTLSFPAGTNLERLSGDETFEVTGTVISGQAGSTDSAGTAVVRGTVSTLSFEARANFSGGSVVDGIYLQAGGCAG